MRAVGALIGLVVLTACASHQAPPDLGDCATGSVQLHSDAACTRTGPASFTLAIRPEAEAINPSPWYAFEIESERGAKAVVTLDYGAYVHRYQPKRRLADGGWRALPAQAVRTSQGGARAEFSVRVPPGGVAIGAQEVLTREERAAWIDDFARRAGFAQRAIGHTLNGHPIVALHAGSRDPSAPLILILGGQHPPEVPGVLGLRAFLEAVAKDGSGLLATHRLLIVPELNPDGVAGGHWRLNSGHVDLNRDWGPFTQLETRAVRAELDWLTGAGARPVLMLDFHATRRNTFYTPLHEATLSPQNFASRWIAQIDLVYDGEMPVVSADHNSDRPTAKVWFAERYGAPGLTVEYGDETDRHEIEALSTSFAHALVILLAGGE